MAAVVTGSKTVTTAVAPHLPASLLTSLMATALENLTNLQLNQIVDARNRVPHGTEPNYTIGSLFN